MLQQIQPEEKKQQQNQCEEKKLQQQNQYNQLQQESTSTLLQKKETITSFRLAVYYHGKSNGADKFAEFILQKIVQHAPNVAFRKDFYVNFGQQTMIIDFVEADDAKKICGWINKNINNFCWQRFVCTEAKLIEVIL